MTLWNLHLTRLYANVRQTWWLVKTFIIILSVDLSPDRPDQKVEIEISSRSGPWSLSQTGRHFARDKNAFRDSTRSVTDAMTIVQVMLLVFISITVCYNVTSRNHHRTGGSVIFTGGGGYSGYIKHEVINDRQHTTTTTIIIITTW